MTTKHETHFEDWFDTLVILLSEKGINFRDRDSVRTDYDDGFDVLEVADEIAHEYGD